MASFLTVFGTFMIVLMVLLLWSWYVCPFMNRIIEEQKKNLKEYHEAQASKRKKEDNEHTVGELEKWY